MDKDLEMYLRDLLYSMESTRSLKSHRQWEDDMEKPRYANPLRLLKHGYKVYSQSDEDGIIQEIFKRIGIEHHMFVEIGVGIGYECNTARLLVDGWKGMWIESHVPSVERINKMIAPGYPDTLLVNCIAATPENVNDLVDSDEIDLLSIDVDFNDYWLWQAIKVIPRVVVIEYNATWRPPLSVTTPYDERGWDGLSNYAGASLSALERLGCEKGYSLVGCNYCGVNAFFVRNDLVKYTRNSLIHHKFVLPYTAEEHYEPPRYRFPLLSGHIGRVGPLVRVGP